MSAPKLPHQRPTVFHEGRAFPLSLEPAGWRMRSRSRHCPVDFRTGTTQLAEAKRRAKAWLETHAANAARARRGGGTLAALVEVYRESPKRTQAHVAEINVSRLRTVCRLALGRELDAVTCREVCPALWEEYQRRALAAHGLAFDLATRHRENIAINACTRAARCLFLPSLLARYRAAGLDVRDDAGQCVRLPEPYVPPSAVDDAALVAAIAALPRGPLWLTLSLARYAGLRRQEIAALRGGWIEQRNGSTVIALRDRPEEKWWTKTGKPYTAAVIDAELAAWLTECSQRPGYVVEVGADRDRWFEREPQAWLHAHVKSGKPLHRLRGLYADHISRLTADAVTARLAGIRAAQESLGHTTSATTERHYLAP